MSITDPPTKPRLAPLSDLDAARLLGQVSGILQNELSKVIVGQKRVIEEILIAIFCRGHCLMQGVPGLAKTLLVSTLAQTMDFSFRRIQFTPDLMPADITGTDILQEDPDTGRRPRSDLDARPNSDGPAAAHALSVRVARPGRHAGTELDAGGEAGHGHLAARRPRAGRPSAHGRRRRRPRARAAAGRSPGRPRRMLARPLRKEVAMLAKARIAAVVPVSDVEAAVRFYGDTLGLRLKERRSDLPENREAEFEAADGTLLVYESVGAGQSRHTVAGFRVENIEEAVAALRERGVVFEEYDLPDMKTENGIATIGDVRAAWCRDPDGNILAVESVG